MSHAIGRTQRAMERTRLAEAAAQRDAQNHRSITCSVPIGVGHHETCRGNFDPRLCLCECHDDVTPVDPRTTT